VIHIERSCRRHRTELLDFVVGGLRGPGTPAALDHLEACDRCRTKIESTVLAAAALRRLATDVSTAEPSADAWPRLRDRVTMPRAPRFGLMSPVAGMGMSLAIVVAMVVGAPGLPGSEPEVGGPTGSVVADGLEPVEEAWLRGRMDPTRRAASAQVAAAVAATPTRGPSFLGPDGLGSPAPIPPVGRPAPATSIQ
jgi:hypothetical protein